MNKDRFEGDAVTSFQIVEIDEDSTMYDPYTEDELKFPQYK